MNNKPSQSYNFIGLKVEAMVYSEFFNKVGQWIKDKAGRSHHVAIINAYCAAMSLKDPTLKKIYHEADLIGPDGKPFVYWLKFF